MPVFLTILKILVLAALLLVLLIVFIPVRYRASGKLKQKEPAKQLQPEELLSCAEGEMSVSWFFGALRLRAAYPGSGGRVYREIHLRRRVQCPERGRHGEIRLWHGGSVGRTL